MKKINYFKYLLKGVVVALFALPLFIACNDDDDDYVVIPKDIVGSWSIESWSGWYSFDNSPKQPIVVPDIPENYFVAFNADSTYTTDTTLVGPIMGMGTYAVSTVNNKTYLLLYEKNYPDYPIKYLIEDLTFRNMVLSQSVDSTYTVDSVAHTFKSYEKIVLGSLD